MGPAVSVGVQKQTPDGIQPALLHGNSPIAKCNSVGKDGEAIRFIGENDLLPAVQVQSCKFQSSFRSIYTGDRNLPAVLAFGSDRFYCTGDKVHKAS
jgi:hypothetical protein